MAEGQLSYSLDLPAFDGVVAKLRNNAAVAGPIAGLFRRLSLSGEAHARRGAPRDKAELKRSISSTASAMSARVFSTSNYAVPVEEGRRAGARMPPPAALVGWMRRHGLSDVSPFVIARSIARRGIKGRFFMKAALAKLERELPGEIRRTAREIEQRWGGGP